MLVHYYCQRLCIMCYYHQCYARSPGRMCAWANNDATPAAAAAAAALLQMSVVAACSCSCSSGQAHN